MIHPASAQAGRDHTKMKNSKVKSITDSAVSAALCTLFIIIATYVPFLSVPVSFAVSVPLMYIALRHGINHSIMACLCAAFVSFFIIGDALSVTLLTLTYAVPGLVFGICSSKKMRFPLSIALSALSVLISFVIELMIINGGGDGIANLINSITQTMGETLKSSVAQTQMIPPGDAEVFISEMMTQTANLFLLSLPTIIIATSVIYAYIVSMVGIFFMKRLRVASVSYTKFYMICAPRSMCIITFILLLIIQLGGIEGTFGAALQNLYSLSVFYIAICGLSAIDYSLKKKIPRGILRAIIYIAVFLVGSVLSSFMITVLTVIGYLDGMNGRRTYRKA